jgi:membrane protein YdbS with pleckstrin-like domain
LIQEPAAAAPIVSDEAKHETDIFRLSPVARAFPGQILLGLIFIGLAIGLAIRPQDFSWPRWVPLIPLALGLLLLLLLWIRVKSCSYRLTTQRLFVRRGWLAKHVNELELYRVKDVVVDQGVLQRLLGYGTITVLADDDTTPAVDLARISKPTRVKEMIRTQYRAARQREGVRPTEFMQSP